MYALYFVLKSFGKFLRFSQIFQLFSKSTVANLKKVTMEQTAALLRACVNR